MEAGSGVILSFADSGRMVRLGVWLVMAARKARMLGIGLAVAGVIAAVVTIAYVRRSAPLPGPEPVTAPEPTATVPVDSNDAGADEFLPLGTVLGVNRPAPPPVSFAIGPPPEGADALDLSTPAAAVYSVLSLIDAGKTERLPACFVKGAADVSSDLYPAYLSHPVALVDVVEDGNVAKVVWEAAVHTPFTRNGREWSTGETITLTTRLVQVDGLWKLTKLCDGEDDGLPKDDVPID
jgi:hypothetical protein